MTFTLHDDLTFDEFAAYVREHLSYSDRKPVRTENSEQYNSSFIDSHVCNQFSLDPYVT